MMIQRIFIFMALLYSLVGCSKEPIDFKNPHLDPPVEQETSTVIFSLKVEDVGVGTKSDVLAGQYDSKIWNYNIYCFNRSTGERQRLYSTSATSGELSLSNGVWDLFVFANADRDMGDMSRYEVENYTYIISKTSDLVKGYRLMMVHQSSITVGSDMTVPIELERLVARFDININFSGEAVDYKIIKTEVFNGASSCRVFNNDKSLTTGVDFESQKSGTMTFYALENLQGVDNSITNPKDKNYRTAPPNATFIRVTVESEIHTITYDYYLGGNISSDFNIRRNTKYEIDINITGRNTSDWRINSTLLGRAILVDNHHLYVHGSGTHETWTFEFKAGNKQDINVEFFADIDNNEKETTYMGMFFTEHDYLNYFLKDDYFDKYHLLESKYGDPCILFNFDEGEGGLGQKYARATVKPNVRYRLVMLCHQIAGQPPSIGNDIRVYMERGTEQVLYKDMRFSVYP